jgi:ubiquinone/menaquinone biosynthesis C-methylase UbiE
MSRYRYNQQTPQLSARFDHAMSALAEKQKKAILDNYDFSDLNTILDIAGGQGSLLISILTKYPKLNAILFDVAGSIQRSQKLIAQEQLESRCQTIAGSFFEIQTIPIEKDLYILKHVLHNWDDEQALTILKNCRQVMRVNTKLLIIEGVISPKTAQRSVLLDLHLLVSFASGKLRTEAEFNQLLQQSGFQLIQITATQSDMSIIEAQAI